MRPVEINVQQERDKSWRAVRMCACVRVRACGSAHLTHTHTHTHTHAHTHTHTAQTGGLPEHEAHGSLEYHRDEYGCQQPKDSRRTKDQCTHTQAHAHARVTYPRTHARTHAPTNTHTPTHTLLHRSSSWSQPTTSLR